MPGLEDAFKTPKVKEALKKNEHDTPGQPSMWREYDEILRPTSVTCVDPKTGKEDVARSEEKAKKLLPVRTEAWLALGVDPNCRKDKDAAQCIDDGQTQVLWGEKRLKYANDPNHQQVHPNGFIPVTFGLREFHLTHQTTGVDGNNNAGVIDETIKVVAAPEDLNGTLLGAETAVATPKSGDPTKGPCTIEYDITLVPKIPKK